MNIEICKLTEPYREKTFNLMSEVITDNFRFENVDLEKFRDLLEGEIATQKRRLDLDHSYYFPCFYLAKDGDRVIGVMGYGPIEQTIKDALKKINKSEDGTVEIFSAYVSPNFQGRGVGSQLLETILEDLKTQNFRYFCLFTGYEKGKAFWPKKLGEPTLILRNYYTDNTDCWLWIKEIND